MLMTRPYTDTSCDASLPVNILQGGTTQRKVGSQSFAAICSMIVLSTATEAAIARPELFDGAPPHTRAFAPALTRVNYVSNTPDVSDWVIVQIRKIGLLADGWHRRESRAASPAAVDEAERFARGINWQEHQPPVVSLTDDGEINLLWQTDDLYLDIGFIGDRTYTFFGKTKDGRTFLGDDVHISNPLQAELLALLRIQA